MKYPYNENTEVSEELSSPTSVRSNSVQEIISRRPGFLEKWALWIFLFVLILLIGSSWFLKYPDVVQAKAILMASNAPREIVARQDGKLTRLFVKNDELVDQGKTIAWVESTANHRKVFDFSAIIDSGIVLLTANKAEKVSTLFRNSFQDLGELQSAYQSLNSACQQFNDYLVNGYYSKRKQALVKDQIYLEQMHLSINKQIELMQQDVSLTQETFNATNSLFKDKVVSSQEIRDQKSKLLGKQLSIPQLEANLLTNENAQSTKGKDIAELEHTILQQKTIFLQALQTTKSIVDDWKKRYVITAPVKGKVVFLVPLQEQQFIQSGKTIGYVNPLDSRYSAQATLPQNNFGKLRIGQKVQLRFDAYPYQEFGFVEGRVDYISKVPSDSGFLAIMNLPKELTTNYGRRIQYRSGLRSQALIITHDARLLQRFYYMIVKNVQK